MKSVYDPTIDKVKNFNKILNNDFLDFITNGKYYLR